MMDIFKIKLYKRLLDSVSDGVYYIDINRKIRFWSRGMESLTGTAYEGVKGKTISDSGIAYKDEKGSSIPSYKYPVALCFQEKRRVAKHFFIDARGKGRIPVEESAVPLFDKDVCIGAVVTLRDLSACLQEVRANIVSEKSDRLVPICGWCKKIRNDDYTWEKLETYLEAEGFGIFTHGMCPTCADTIFEKKVYLESYQKICKEISTSISIDKVLQLIVSNVVKVMSVKASSVRLLNGETRQLELAAYYGLSEKYADKGPVSYDASIDDALAGKPVSVYDITEHKESRYYQEAVDEGIRSILSIPLRIEKEVIGVLRMYTGEPVKYTEEDLRFVSAIADQAAIAISNARRFETAVSSQKEYRRVFREITKAVSSTLDVEEVLQMIVRKIPEVMKLKGSTLRLLNGETRQLELAAYYGLSEKYADKGPVSYDASIDDALAGKPVSVYDITEHKESRYYQEAIDEGIRSILSIPLRLDKEVIGVLRVYTEEPVKYTDEDLRFMSAITDQAAIAISNARHFETAVSNEKEYLRVFREITKAVSSSLNVNEVLDMIVRKIPEVMKLKAATVRLLDHTGKRLELVASHGLSEKYKNKGPVDTEKNIIEALKENPVAIYDVQTDSRVQYQKEAAEEGIKSMLTLPVIARSKVIGILRLLTDTPRNFSQQEIDFVAMLAEECGMAIENATMHERLKKDYDEIMKYVEGTVFERNRRD